VFFNLKLRQLGRGVLKSSLTTTMITGSSALGEALPPHFQFQTLAKSEDTHKAQMEMGISFPPIWWFGMPEMRLRKIVIGLNEKGGMDDDEFASI
jgi:hypothetical protein